MYVQKHFVLSPSLSGFLKKSLKKENKFLVSVKKGSLGTCKRILDATGVLQLMRVSANSKNGWRNLGIILNPLSWRLVWDQWCKGRCFRHPAPEPWPPLLPWCIPGMLLFFWTALCTDCSPLVIAGWTDGSSSKGWKRPSIPEKLRASMWTNKMII